jgi:hypothetical protein
MHRGARFLALAFAAVLATACTRLAYMNASLAYSNATPMLSWMVDDYVGLGPGEEEWVDARIARAMAWHRARELPRYRAFLASVAERSSRPYTEAEVGEALGEVHAAYERVVEHVLPDVAEFLARLDERRLAHLEHRFAEENERIAKEAAGGALEKRHAQSARRFAAHLEEWVGTLSQAQRAIVYRREAARVPMAEERLAGGSPADPPPAGWVAEAGVRGEAARARQGDGADDRGAERDALSRPARAPPGPHPRLHPGHHAPCRFRLIGGERRWNHR